MLAHSSVVSPETFARDLLQPESRTLAGGSGKQCMFILHNQQYRLELSMSPLSIKSVMANFLQASRSDQK